jgi:DNA-binding MarR family transcriptional regulator
MHASTLKESPAPTRFDGTAPTQRDAAAMPDEDAALAQACRMLAFIRVTREVFPAMRDLAEHPGWEILLHLFIAGHEGRTLTTADLSEKTGTWRPLAVRYVEMLFERGFIDRDVSAEKPEGWALSLTPATHMRLRKLLCATLDGTPGLEAVSGTI